MKEIWKVVIGYEGFYEVSSIGKIRSKDRYVNATNGSTQLKKGIILKSPIDKYGYHKIKLSKYGKVKDFTVHRLVALNFVKNIFNKPQVNHKDGNKLNNKVDNLEWMTISEQSIHAYKYNLKSKTGIKNSMVKLTEEEVKKIKEMLDMGSRVGEISKEFNVTSSCISSIKSGRIWKHIKI